MITSELKWEGTFDAAHFIPRHPKCGRLHGHTYHVLVTLIGNLEDGKPYLVDYGNIKKEINKLDHKLLVPQKLTRGHTELKVKEQQDMTLITWNDFGRLQAINLSNDMICLLPIEDTSAERIAEYFLGQFKTIGFDWLRQAEVTIKETPNTEATAWWVEKD